MPACIECKEDRMLKGAYSMDTLSIPAGQTVTATGQTVTAMEARSADCIHKESDGVQNREISYEHKGYQIRIHFNGDKTLIQCIKNLAKQKTGG